MIDTLTIVRDFAKDRLDVPLENIVATASLKDLGIDSLGLLELIFEFEEKLNLSVPQDIDPPQTVGDLLAIVEQLQQSATAPSTTA